MLEFLKPGGQSFWIRPISCSPRLQDGSSVKALEASLQHRAIGLIKQAPADVHHASGVDPEQIPVVRCVMNSA